MNCPLGVAIRSLLPYTTEVQTTLSMTTQTKRKLVCVSPISNVATFKFNCEMDSLHSCYVDDEKLDIMYLTSINGKYKFMMHKKEDCNWKIVK